MTSPAPAHLTQPLPGVIDAHAHTSSRQFEADHDAVMQRSWAAGLAAVVEVGGDTDSSLRCLELARRDARVFAVAGLHPHGAAQLERERDGLRALFEGGGFVGVGEIGLDFFRNLSPADAQLEAFQWQLELAREFELPVVIHSRNSDVETFALLEAWANRVGRYLGARREIGMLHCFAGDAALGLRYVELGFVISVPGTVTYKGNTRGQEVACTIPLASLVLETDCPYLTPVPHRGERNEPAYVAETGRFVATLRACEPEVLVRVTAENTVRLFGLALPPEARSAE
jgi:TatD DNase family protein